jgi:Fur family peroxide stress response transcriptional regulator
MKTLLEENELRATYQRLRILEYLKKHIGKHPTAEMMHEVLSREIPTISLATIYNSLNAFVEKGLACRVTITGSEIRYDFLTSPHHHLLCRRCGRIIDVDVVCAFAQGRRRAVQGHMIEEVHGYFRGICKDCAGNSEQTAEDRNSS